MGNTKDLVALTSIEWPDGDGGYHLLRPGDPIPDLMSDSDVKELAKWGSIGTVKDHRQALDSAAADARVQSLSAQAEADGYRLVKASDGASAADRKA